MAGVLTCVRAQGRRCALVDSWCTTAERRLRGNSSGRSSARLELMASHWQKRMGFRDRQWVYGLLDLHMK